MIDRRNCIDCIFHDGKCIRKDCRFISRERAENAIDKVNDVIINLVRYLDIKEIIDTISKQ